MNHFTNTTYRKSKELNRLLVITQTLTQLLTLHYLVILKSIPDKHQNALSVIKELGLTGSAFNASNVSALLMHHAQPSLNTN